ncbi:hypothetical protein [Streptomyces sp. NPDC058374]
MSDVTSAVPLEPDHVERFGSRLLATVSRPATAQQAHRTIGTA